MANTKNSTSIGLISSEYTNPVDAMTFKVFNIFEAFRVNPELKNNEESTQIVLLLVSLYKDGIISSEIINKEFSVASLKKSISESNLDNGSKQTYLSVIDVLFDSLLKVISHSFDYLSLYLFQIEKELLNEYFPAIFDDTIYRIAQSQGRYAAEFIQPVELTRFMCGLVDLKMDAKVFNPFAGIASFGINLHDEQAYFGQEINQKTWVLGVLRLMAYGKLANTKFERADSIEEWPVDSKFDLIVSNPPLGMRIDIHDAISNSNIKSSEHFLLEKGIQLLSVGGKMVAVLSQGILFRGGRELELRKQLVENDLIDTIISFPGGLFNYTAIPFVIMVLSSHEKTHNKVRFIKADNYVVEKNRREKVLHDELLLNVYNSVVEFNDDVRIIDKGQLRENDYNLSVNRYFDDTKIDTGIPDGAKQVRLGELVDTFSRGFIESKTGKVINISDLAESVDNFEKLASEFEIGNIPISSQKIESSVLLLSRIRSLKPTYCKVVEGEAVYCSNNIIPLLVDESKIYIPYLILELNSERVSKFVRSRLTGITIPTLSKKDILEIPILLYSIEEQKAKFTGFLDAIARKKKEELISFSKIHGLESDIHEQNAFLRHTLAGPVSNLEGTVKNIQSIIDNYALQFPDIWKMKVSDKHKFTLKEYVSNLSRDITKISTTIGKQLKQELSLSDNPKELIDILNFLLRFTEEFNENKTKNFTLLFDFDDDYTDLFETYVNGAIYSPKVLLNKNLLTDMLNNLIENAEKHAFIEGQNNRIEIQLLGVLEDSENPKVQILFSNTGKPLPENFTIDDFSRKGNAIGANAGNGFGGWYISEIVKYFGGSIDLIDETGPEGLPDGDLSTSFEINLPVVYEEKL